MIQLYLRFLCCTSAFLSLNTILSLFSHFCSHPLFCSFFLVCGFSPPFPLCSPLVAFLFLFCILSSLEWDRYCLCYPLFLCPSTLPLALVLFLASSPRFIVCSPHVHSMVKPCSSVLKCSCSKYTVGVMLTLHLCSSMRVCCCNFFASESCGLLQDVYCFPLTNFYSALNVISVSE